MVFIYIKNTLIDKYSFFIAHNTNQKSRGNTQRLFKFSRIVKNNFEMNKDGLSFFYLNSIQSLQSAQIVICAVYWWLVGQQKTAQCEFDSEITCQMDNSGSGVNKRKEVPNDSINKHSNYIIDFNNIVPRHIGSKSPNIQDSLNVSSALHNHSQSPNQL